MYIQYVSTIDGNKAVEAASSTWGNSEAIRLPKSLLRLAHLGKGDKVNLFINSEGHIEIAPMEEIHRHVEPMKGVTFESLFRSYAPKSDSQNNDPWNGLPAMGAERELWGL